MKPPNSGILTINGGSSSIKFALYRDGEPLKRGLYGKIDRIGLNPHANGGMLHKKPNEVNDKELSTKTNTLTSNCSRGSMRRSCSRMSSSASGSPRTRMALWRNRFRKERKLL